MKEHINDFGPDDLLEITEDYFILGNSAIAHLTAEQQEQVRHNAALIEGLDEALPSAAPNPKKLQYALRKMELDDHSLWQKIVYKCSHLVAGKPLFPGAAMSLALLVGFVSLMPHSPNNLFLQAYRLESSLHKDFQMTAYSIERLDQIEKTIILPNI